MAETPITPDRTITLLPPHLIDQIAAGEVIERPASVVKELIENALDAHAATVAVEVAGAGEEEIRVVDDGIGMSPADVKAAVQRHATSKIRDIDDLAGIVSFGFRGEALAAIASVSHVEIISRRKPDDSAAMMFWEGGTRTDSGTAGAPVGTAVTVRHLFFNTPARREYMRSPVTESRRIIETVTDFACYHYRVAFSLVVDGRPTLQLAPAADLFGRLVDLYGAKVGELLLPFQGGDAELGVSGYIGKPELARTTRDRILTYVNGRRVASQSLAHAATAAFGETIPRGRFPFAIIAVAINPRRVDVNVHPAKREVRFASDRAVYDLVYYSINKTVFTAPRVASVAPVLRIELSPSSAAVAQSERLPFAPPAPDTSVGAVREPPVAPAPSVPVHDASASAPAAAPPPATAVRPGAEGAASIWQFRDVYIVTAVGDELWIIDQHTAHERVLYEEILRRAEQKRPESQRLLFPESIELEAREWEVFEGAVDVLASLGFEARVFGARTALLEGIPTGLRARNPVTLFRRVLEDLELARRGGEDLTKAAAASTACRAAVMAGDRLKPEEMQALFARLMNTSNPFSCPHGRPTMVKIPIADFDRKFCRA